MIEVELHDVEIRGEDRLRLFAARWLREGGRRSR
jgi:hypothetical protein